MERWSADRITSAADLMRMMNDNAIVDIIVRGTDRKYYLLHNIYVSNSHGNCRISGISGRSLESKYWEITSIDSNSFFAKAEKVLPTNRGEHGARLWANQELSRMNEEYANEEGLSRHDQGRRQASTWLKQIRYWMDYVWGYDMDSDYAEEDGEKEVH
jgi:hypothetical protein